MFTAVLVLVVFGATRSSMPAGFAAIPIGFTLALVHLISIPIDNTSVNPARSFATAIFADGFAFEQLWVFIVFPIIGGVIGALAWQLLEGDKMSMPSMSMGSGLLSGFGKAPGAAKAPAAKRTTKKSSPSWLSGFGKAPASSAPARRAPVKKARKR